MHLRVSSTTFRKIVQLIPNKHHGWSTEYEVICFLYWMACGCSYRVAAGFLGFSRFTVRNIIHKMLKEFVKLRHLINHGSVEDYERISSKFCRKAKTNAFNKFIGAIDGTHVRIKCPVNRHDEYINHKKFYSIQVQAVADCNLRFTDVFVGFPGSVHDTRVFLNSQLYVKGIYPPNGYYLFGDKGYPCQISPVAVITPFKEPLTTDQARFNAAHSRGRIVVECAFGVLKTRWRNIFNRELELNIKHCIQTIFSAFVLHNICIMQEEFDPYFSPILEESVNANESSDRELADSAEGIRAREEIFATFLQIEN